MKKSEIRKLVLEILKSKNEIESNFKKVELWKQHPLSMGFHLS